MLAKALLPFAFLAWLTTGAMAMPALDPAPMTPAQLLERADNAAGELAPGAYVRTYVSDGGGLHTAGVTKISGDDRETVEHSGPFTTAFGTFQGRRWTQDANGVVVLQTGFHDTSDPDANALAHADSTTALHVLGVTHDAPQLYVLEVAPPGGPRELRYYDAQTYLLNRIEIAGPNGRTKVWSFSRYRPVFGELIPYTTRYTDGRSANDTVTQITSFVKSPVQISGIPVSRKLLPPSQTAAITISATFDDDGIVVPVNIGSGTYNFLLDSGSDSLAMSPALAAQLGFARYGLSKADVTGEFDVSRTIVPELSIGSLHLSNLAFSVVPLDKPEDRDRIAGVLGMDFWASAIVGIDFKNKSVTLFPPNASPPDAAKLGSMPIALDDGVPRVPASIDGVQGNFLLDTGSASTVVFRHFFVQLRSTTPMDQMLETMWIGGNTDMPVFAVPDFAMGGVQFKQASIAVPPAGSVDLPDYDGIIGRNIMEYYVMYFDYEGRAIYLRPNV